MKGILTEFVTKRLFLSAVGFGGTESVSNRLYDRGVAVPIIANRGIVIKADGAGRNVVLIWLQDHRRCHALLMVDATTGKTEQFLIPFARGGIGAGPLAALFSSRNKYYTHFNSHFIEFDSVRRNFTLGQMTAVGLATSIIENDKGVI